MTEPVSEISIVRFRVDRLERENRLLKRTGLALLALAGAALLMGQARTSRTVTANGFSLVDAHGRTRAELSMVDGEPELMLYRRDRTPMASLGENEMPGLTLYGSNGESTATLRGGAVPGLKLYGEKNHEPLVSLTTDNDNSALALYAGKGDLVASLEAVPAGSRLDLYGGDKRKNDAALMAWPQGPTALLTDAAGYETVIGSTNMAKLPAVKHHKISAASILMVRAGNKRRVLWQAPSR